MKFSHFRTLSAAGLLSVALAACATSSPVAQEPTQAAVQQVQQQVAAPTPTPVDDDEQCFQQLDNEQLGRLDPYVAPQPGTQNGICVLEPDDDGYDQHYYQENEGFSYFWYYALLSRTARTSVLTTGVIGEPTLVEYITLSSWTSVDKYGHPATTYRKDSKGKWSRLKSELPGQVKQIRYGSAAPVPPNTQKTPPPPPAGYQKQQQAASTGVGNGQAGSREAEADQYASAEEPACQGESSCDEGWQVGEREGLVHCRALPRSTPSLV